MRVKLLRFVGFALIAGILSAGANAIPVQLGTTGHYYEYIVTTGHITWEDARDAAAASVFDPGDGTGPLNGYLATLTSIEENTFVGLLSPDERGWLGGSDAAVEGQWEWVTGPEAGTLFFDGNRPFGGGVPGIFNDFVEFNPSDGFGGPQDYLLHVGGLNPGIGDASGDWFPRASAEFGPFPAGGPTVAGYFLEFGRTNLITTTVPEPAGGLLLGGLVVLSLLRRYSK